MRAVTFVAVLATIGAGEARAPDAAGGEKVFGVCTRSARTRRMPLGPSSTA